MNLKKHYDYYEEVECEECERITEVRGTNIEHDGEDVTCDIRYKCECGNLYIELGKFINDHYHDYIIGNMMAP